jgi:periplasmic mercuric ion binding protein
MKKTIAFIVTSFILSTAWSQSGTVTTSIKVFGNCGMCKARIEKVLDHKGIKKAEWNRTSKQLEVVYNSDKISEQKIHELIASAGHDTEKVKAKDEVYASLPFCCLYRDHEHE